MLQRSDQPLQWTPAISNMLYLKQKSRYFQNLRNLVPRASFHAMIDLSWRVIPVYQKTKRGPGNEVANYDFTPCKNSCYLEYALSRIVRISNPQTIFSVHHLLINYLIFLLTILYILHWKQKSVILLTRQPLCMSEHFRCCHI